MPRTKRITDVPQTPRKGIKTSKGQPIFYAEKKQRVNLTLTSTAIEELEKLAQALNLSVSEFVERIGRGIIPVLLESSFEPEQDNVERIAQRVAKLLGKPQLVHTQV